MPRLFGLHYRKRGKSQRQPVTTSPNPFLSSTPVTSTPNLSFPHWTQYSNRISNATNNIITKVTPCVNLSLPVNTTNVEKCRCIKNISFSFPLSSSSRHDFQNLAFMSFHTTSKIEKDTTFTLIGQKVLDLETLNTHFRRFKKRVCCDVRSIDINNEIHPKNHVFKKRKIMNQSKVNKLLLSSPVLTKYAYFQNFNIHNNHNQLKQRFDISQDLNADIISLVNWSPKRITNQRRVPVGLYPTNKPRHTFILTSEQMKLHMSYPIDVSSTITDSLQKNISNTSDYQKLYWETLVYTLLSHRIPDKRYPTPTSIQLFQNSTSEKFELALELKLPTYGRQVGFILGTIQDIFDWHVNYKTGPIPECVVAYIGLQIIECLNEVHHLGKITHNSLGLDSFWIQYQPKKSHYSIPSWTLTIIGFGLEGRVYSCCNDVEKDKMVDNQLDKYALANIIHTLLLGSTNFSWKKSLIHPHKREIEYRSLILSNMFLRGRVAWGSVFDSLLNGEDLDYCNCFSNTVDTSSLYGLVDIIEVENYFLSMVRYSKKVAYGVKERK